MHTLAAEIHALSHLGGTFTLRSGRQANTYFDKYRFETMPELLAEIAREMVPLIPRQTEVLAGLELGGVPIATMLSHYSGLPTAFVRKAAKQYGPRACVRGLRCRGNRFYWWKMLSQAAAGFVRRRPISANLEPQFRTPSA